MAKVLMVEDSPVFRDTLRAFLQERFPLLEIEEACHESTVLEKIKDFPPELVLMDIRLPDGDGLTLTRKLLELSPGIKVVIITSYDTKEYRQAALETGAVGFLVKGRITPEEILDLVGEALGRGEAPPAS